MKYLELEIMKRGHQNGKQPKSKKQYQPYVAPGSQAPVGEMKYFDSTLTATVLVASTSWTGCAQDPAAGTLFVPQSGSAINQRIGREVKVMKIKFRGRINIPQQATQSAADPAVNVRVCLVQDSNTNAGAFTSANVLGSLATTSLYAFANLDFLGRYRILKDKIFNLSNFNLANDTGATGGLVQSGMCVPFKFAVVFQKPVSVHFNSTNGGTFADIVDNSFHLMANCNTISALAPTIEYQCRVCYKE